MPSIFVLGQRVYITAGCFRGEVGTIFECPDFESEHYSVKLSCYVNPLGYLSSELKPLIELVVMTRKHLVIDVAALDIILTLGERHALQRMRQIEGGYADFREVWSEDDRVAYSVYSGIIEQARKVQDFTGAEGQIVLTKA